MRTVFGECELKRALITGITGQDGSYLAELLLERGYEVHGIVRRVAIENPKHRLWRITHFLDRVCLHAASLESMPSVYRVMHTVEPHECYHLAAQSFVGYSFEDEFSTLSTNINGTHHVFAAVRDVVPECLVYFAGSSEMFGKAIEIPQTEKTTFYPRSTYGISKVAGFHLAKHYREAYGIRIWCGILFNHESPRRGFEFVTRKITSYAARIKAGLETKISLGNVDARRDWGHARDYVYAMKLMLQRDEPDDYVIATGKQHSVIEFVQVAFSYLGLNYKNHLNIDSQLLRPVDVDCLVGDFSKAKEELGWVPCVQFDELVKEMVDEDLRATLSQ
tara:strand:- start:669 stop:1670 length:1002 start_codon:yes stop_codon:yes gene_type:complete